MAEFVRSGGIEGSVNIVFGGYRYYRVRHVIGTHFFGVGCPEFKSQDLYVCVSIGR